MITWLVVNRGPENKKHVAEFMKWYGIKHVQVSAYHLQVNGMVEQGHNPITEALAHMTDGGIGNWVANLSVVLLADWMTIHQLTGWTPFFMVYGSEAVLLVELWHLTWRVLDWERVKDWSELIAIWAEQLRLCDEDMEEVKLQEWKKQSEAKEIFDGLKQLRNSEILVGDTWCKVSNGYVNCKEAGV